MLCWGAWKSREANAALQQTLYCLWLPIHPLLEGGEPNDIRGVTKVLGVKAAWVT